MTRQLTFDLPARPALDRDDFFVSGANAHAVARLDGPESWANGRLVLVGPEGAGKTHLAHVWASATGASIIAATHLTPDTLAPLSGPVAVEDIDRLSPEGEVALFHLINLATQGSQPLLITSRTAPARLDIALPDLKSRLEAADLVRIEAPDDALLAAMLVKLFTDRQIDVAPSLIQWMLPRMPRSFAETQALVARLDAAALAEKKPVTRDLARRILDTT